MDRVGTFRQKSVSRARLDVRPAPVQPTAQIAILVLFLLTLSALLALFGPAWVALQLSALNASAASP